MARKVSLPCQWDFEVLLLIYVIFKNHTQSAPYELMILDWRYSILMILVFVNVEVKQSIQHLKHSEARDKALFLHRYIQIRCCNNQITTGTIIQRFWDRQAGSNFSVLMQRHGVSQPIPSLHPPPTHSRWIQEIAQEGKRICIFEGYYYQMVEDHIG